MSKYDAFISYRHGDLDGRTLTPEEMRIFKAG